PSNGYNWTSRFRSSILSQNENAFSNHVVTHSSTPAEAVMRQVRLLLSIGVFTGLLAMQPARAASVSDFLEYNLLSAGGGVLFRGRLHEPAEFASDPSEPRPLILFFHGAGESGTNNLAQINGNIDNLLAAAKT